MCRVCRKGLVWLVLLAMVGSVMLRRDTICGERMCGGERIIKLRSPGDAGRGFVGLFSKSVERMGRG